MLFEDCEGRNTARTHKRELRKAAIERRSAMPAAHRDEASRMITEKTLAMIEYRRARSVMSYCSFGSELDTRWFNEAVLASGKRLVLPRIDPASKRLEIHAVADPATDLVAGLWGIREPVATRCARVALEDVDFVLVPGAVFDRHGGRIGYGKGYYDQLFASVGAIGGTPWRTAGCFSVQLVPSVPMESFDVPMHALVTELESFRAAPAGAMPSPKPRRDR